MSDEQNMLENIAEYTGEPFSVNIVDNTMQIRPAEAGIAIFAALTRQDEREQAAWEEADRIARTLEEVREDNARLRDLFEMVHPVLVELGQEELAEELLRTVYPVYGVNADGSTVKVDG